MNSMADRVRTIRTQLGMNQTELANASGVSQQAISMIERGLSKGTKHVLALAAALGVSPDWLQSGVGPQKAPDWKQVIDLTTLPEPARGAALALCRAVQSGDLSGEQLVAFVDAILFRKKHDS